MKTLFDLSESKKRRVLRYDINRNTAIPNILILITISVFFIWPFKAFGGVPAGSSVDEYYAAIEQASTIAEVDQIKQDMMNDPAYYDGTNFKGDDGMKILSRTYKRRGDIKKAQNDLDGAIDEYQQAKNAWDDGTLDQAIKDAEAQKTGTTTPTPVTPTSQTPKTLEGSGQIPTTFTKPDGSQLSRDDIIKISMKRRAAGVAPFGVDSTTGNPYWPLEEPTVPSPSSGSSANDQLNPNDQPLKIRETLLSLKPDVTGNLAKISQITRPGSKKSTTSDNSLPTKSQNLTDQEMLNLQKRFMYDCVNHARYIYEGKDEEALQIVYLWQSIARLYPEKIDEITLKAASINGQSNFKTWFNSVLTDDWQKIYGTTPPDLL